VRPTQCRLCPITTKFRSAADFALNPSPLMRLRAMLPALRKGWRMTGVDTTLRGSGSQNNGLSGLRGSLGLREVLRSGATEFVYKREVQPRRKLGAWIETLSASAPMQRAFRACGGSKCAIHSS
jgi:hypothetical protein